MFLGGMYASHDPEKDESEFSILYSGVWKDSYLLDRDDVVL